MITLLSMGASDPITELSLNSLGINKISVTNWNNNSIPQVMVGSIWAVSASVFVVQDNHETITGLSSAADGLVYIYSNSSGGFLASTTNIPAWNETLYGWYDPITGFRCVMTVYKNGSSYTAKKVLYNKNSLNNGYAKVNIGVQLVSVSVNRSGSAGTSNAYQEFIIKKPIFCYASIQTSGPQSEFGGDYSDGGIYSYQNGNWRVLPFILDNGSSVTTLRNSGINTTFYFYGNLIFFPGSYRIRASSITDDNNDNITTITSIFVISVYGLENIELSEIIELI